MKSKKSQIRFCNCETCENALEVHIFSENEEDKISEDLRSRSKLNEVEDDTYKAKLKNQPRPWKRSKKRIVFATKLLKFCYNEKVEYKNGIENPVSHFFKHFFISSPLLIVSSYNRYVEYW